MSQISFGKWDFSQKVLLHRAALHPSIHEPIHPSTDPSLAIPWSLLAPGIVLIQVHDLVEPHRVPMDPLLQPVQVPSPPLSSVVPFTNLLGVCLCLVGGLNQFWS